MQMLTQSAMQQFIYNDLIIYYINLIDSSNGDPSSNALQKSQLDCLFKLLCKLWMTKLSSRNM